MHEITFKPMKSLAGIEFAIQQFNDLQTRFQESGILKLLTGEAGLRSLSMESKDCPYFTMDTEMYGNVNLLKYEKDGVKVKFTLLHDMTLDDTRIFQVPMTGTNYPPSSLELCMMFHHEVVAVLTPVI